MISSKREMTSPYDSLIGESFFQKWRDAGVQGGGRRRTRRISTSRDSNITSLHLLQLRFRYQSSIKSHATSVVLVSHLFIFDLYYTVITIKNMKNRQSCDLKKARFSFRKSRTIFLNGRKLKECKKGARKNLTSIKSTTIIG